MINETVGKGMKYRSVVKLCMLIEPNNIRKTQTLHHVYDVVMQYLYRILQARLILQGKTPQAARPVKSRGDMVGRGQ